MGNAMNSETIQSWVRSIEQNYQADPELALRTCEDLISLGRKTDDDSLIALGYYHMGVTYYIKNDGNKFFDAISDAISYLTRIQEWELMARCYNFLGIHSANHANAALGLDYYLTALNCCKNAQAEEFEYSVMVNMGMLYTIYGRYEEAIDVLSKSRDYYSKHPELPRYKDYMIYVYENMAKAYLSNGNFSEARACFDKIESELGGVEDKETKLVVWAVEAMYYHATGEEEQCDLIIQRIHTEISDTLPIMDMFDDLYDYIRILLEKGKKEEFWEIIDLIEPKVRTLDIPSVMLRLLGLKIGYYRKYHMHAEYLQAAALHYEYSERANQEHKKTMNNVLNLRKTLELVNKAKEEMAHQNVLLQKKSETDALTGLNNRLGLNEYSETAFKEAISKGITFAVEILDLDDFKSYNDHFGHQKGDECLQLIAGAIKSMEEFGAYTARYGGDEFMLIYEDITKEQMVECAAELRKRVLALKIEHPKSKISPYMTISQGVCWDAPRHGNRMWDYLHAADDLLYKVKKVERNNFCVGNLKETEEEIVMSCARNS